MDHDVRIQKVEERQDRFEQQLHSIANDISTLTSVVNNFIEGQQVKEERLDRHRPTWLNMLTAVGVLTAIMVSLATAISMPWVTYVQETRALAHERVTKREANMLLKRIERLEQPLYLEKAAND